MVSSVARMRSEYPSARPSNLRKANLCRLILGSLSFVLFPVLLGFCADPSDPVLDLLLQKGIVTEAEVQKARADAEKIRTNELANMMPPMESKWKISKAIKNVE